MKDLFQTDLSWLDAELGAAPVQQTKRNAKPADAETSVRWTWSAEGRAKISHSHKTSEKAARARATNCELARQANTGRKHSAELKARWSEIAKVREANRVISDETRAKLSKTSRIRDVMTPNGVFPSRAAVARAAGVHPKTVDGWMKRWPQHYYYIKDAK